MTKHRKQWSKDEKLAALTLAKREGFLKASKESGISQTSLYKWRDKLETLGDEGLTKSDHSLLLKEITVLLQENKQLKTIVADQILANHIKEDLLKKTNK